MSEMNQTSQEMLDKVFRKNITHRLSQSVPPLRRNRLRRNSFSVTEAKERRERN